MIMFKIRKGKLNMTVCNRSNDVIWGAYGANVVQFSMLQEYIADKIGVEVGVYTQASDSFHVYTDNPQFEILKRLPYKDYDPYKYEVESFPLGAEAIGWDNDLFNFCNFVHHKQFVEASLEGNYTTDYFRKVVAPMIKCWGAHKLDRSGLEFVGEIEASDWRLAATQWLTKREK